MCIRDRYSEERKCFTNITSVDKKELKEKVAKTLLINNFQGKWNSLDCSSEFPNSFNVRLTKIKERMVIKML